MHIEEFPDFCGARIICGFPFDYELEECETERERTSYIKDVTRSFDREVAYATDLYAGLVFAAINYEQRKIMVPIFKKRRWKKINSYRNPNSKNMVEVWQKRINTPKRKKKSRR